MIYLNAITVIGLYLLPRYNLLHFHVPPFIITPFADGMLLYSYAPMSIELTVVRFVLAGVVVPE